MAAPSTAPDLGDDAVGDGDVGGAGGCAGAVEHRAPSDDQVVCGHRSPRTLGCDQTRMRSCGRRHANHGHGPPEAEEHPAADDEVGHLVVAERAAQARPERVVHRLVVEGEALGELGRQLLPLGEGVGGGPGGDVGVEALVDGVRLGVLGAGVLADDAVVDQRDRPAGGLALAQRELRVAVDGLGELAHADRHLRAVERPVDVLPHARLGRAVRCVPCRDLTPPTATRSSGGRTSWNMASRVRS